MNGVDQSSNTPFRGKSTRNDLSPEEIPVSQKRQCLDRDTPLVDPTEVTETIMHRVNNAIKDIKSQTSSNTGDDVIANIVTPLITAVTAAITQSVCDVLHKAIKELKSRDEDRMTIKSSAAESALSAKLRVLTYKNDSLEQYTRRENIRIHGLTESGDKEANLEERVLRLLQTTGTKLSSSDIAACHRTGRPRNGSRPVIVRFVSRKSKINIMKSKKKLRENHPSVFINDDLTSLRSRLLGYIKRLDITEKVWTMGGRIHCIKKLPTGMQPDHSSKPVIIETPDDLFDKLGQLTVDYTALGVNHLA